MKRTTILMLLLTVLTAQERRYPVRGVVTGSDRFMSELIVRHAEIKDYMSAMTMPFPVASWDALPESLYVGDSVHFELVVWDDGARIDNLTVVSHSPTVVRMLTAPPPKKVGEIVSDVRFTGSDGQAVTLSATDGRLRLVSFIFTSCPLPTMCPAVDRKHEILGTLFKDDKRAKDNLALISISFDFVRDTPQVLAAYYGEKLATVPGWQVWSSTGHEEDLALITAQAGVSYAGVREGNISHTMNTLLLGPDREVLAIYRGSSWEIGAAQKQIRKELRRRF